MDYMQKIPTLFERNPEIRRYVLDQVVAEAKWVTDGEGTATRKFDGTCVMFDGVKWWARRQVKLDMETPAGFVEVHHDRMTRKIVGWESAEQSGFWKCLAEVLSDGSEPITAGTYELCGPKINNNPEGFDRHVLVPHGGQVVDAPRDFDGLRAWLLANPYEGIVWHHPDGRTAKLKRRDFA